MTFLLDASSLLNLIISRGGGSLEAVRNQHVLDLTLYEAGNALWRLSVIERKLGPEEADSTLDALAKLVGQMKVFPVERLNLTSVMEIATNERVTFYDASYISTAKDRKLVLVTDDGRLSKAASKYVQVEFSSTFGARQPP